MTSAKSFADRHFTLGDSMALCLLYATGVCESADTAFPLDNDQLRVAVLAYIAEHPGAMDTIEGIAEWWIARQHISVNVNRLVSVLDELVRSGSLESVDVAGEQMYRLARSQPGDQ